MKTNGYSPFWHIRSLAETSLPGIRLRSTCDFAQSSVISGLGIHWTCSSMHAQHQGQRGRCRRLIDRLLCNAGQRGPEGALREDVHHEERIEGVQDPETQTVVGSPMPEPMVASPWTRLLIRAQPDLEIMLEAGQQSCEGGNTCAPVCETWTCYGYTSNLRTLSQHRRVYPA